MNARHQGLASASLVPTHDGRFDRSGLRATTPLAAFLLVAIGCTSSGSNGSSATGGTAGATSSAAGSGGGALASGGAAAGGSAGMAPDSCSNTPACGGQVVGTWSVTSATCLTLSGKIPLQGFFSPDCPTADVTGSLQVSGSWTAKPTEPIPTTQRRPALSNSRWGPRVWPFPERISVAIASLCR